MSDINKIPGIKRKDLQKCIKCGEGVANNNQMTFFIVEQKYMVLNIGAIHQLFILNHLLNAIMIWGVAGTDKHDVLPYLLIYAACFLLRPYFCSQVSHISFLSVRLVSFQLVFVTGFSCSVAISAIPEIVKL